MNRREQVQDIEDTLTKQAWYLNPSRWADVHAAEVSLPDDAMTMAGRPIEEVVGDVDELDAYFSGIEERRTLTGAELFNSLDDEGWV